MYIIKASFSLHSSEWVQSISMNILSNIYSERTSSDVIADLPGLSAFYLLILPDFAKDYSLKHKA